MGRDREPASNWHATPEALLHGAERKIHEIDNSAELFCPLQTDIFQMELS